MSTATVASAQIQNGDSILLTKLESMDAKNEHKPIRFGVQIIDKKEYLQSIADYRVYCFHRDAQNIVSSLRQLIRHWDSVIGGEGTEFNNGAFDSVKDVLDEARTRLAIVEETLLARVAIDKAEGGA